MIQRTIAILALLLYLAALALPAFDLEEGDDTYYLGLIVVLVGALSLDPRWLANPLWLVGMLCLWKSRRVAALLTLAAAAILALLCLTYVGTEIAQNASGTKTTILKMGWGYNLWLSSMLLSTGLAVYCFFGRPEASGAQLLSADEAGTPEESGSSVSDD